MKSYYMREEDLKQEEEKIILIKCNEENKEKIKNYFAKNHPYDIPEMLWIQPDDVNEAYQTWVKHSATTQAKAKKK